MLSPALGASARFLPLGPFPDSGLNISPAPVPRAAQTETGHIILPMLTQAPDQTPVCPQAVSPMSWQPSPGLPHVSKYGASAAFLVRLS